MDCSDDDESRRRIVEEKHVFDELLVADQEENSGE